MLLAAKRALAEAGPRLVVTSAGETDLFDLRLECARVPRWADSSVEVRAWPITQQAERAQAFEANSIVFPRLSHAGLTPLIAFSISAKVGESAGKTVFVMNLSLHGAPEDRQDRVVRSLIENRDQLLRYILFLLASGDEAAASSGDLRKLPTSGQDGAGHSLPHHLLETMLRALHRGPAQLVRVASLLEVLRKEPSSSELLSSDFQKIWEPIWDTAQQVMEK